MASNINATNNVKNSERILAHVISRINQKINLNSDTKKQISDFILSRMTGGIKIEFLNELPEGEFEYAEFSAKDYSMHPYTIHIAYGTSSDKKKYQNILYVVIKKTIINEVKVAVEDTRNFYDSNYDFVRFGVITRIRNHLEELNLHFDETTKTQIDNFLIPLINGRVWVNFEEMPDSEGYHYISIVVKNHIMKLAYGHNDNDERYPNILYVSITEAYELNFRKFWQKHYLPTCLLDEAIKLLDLSQKITVLVYERAYLWRQMLNTAKKPIVFGQKIDSEGQFWERRPIGYVEDNLLVITSPNERIDECSGITYTFN